MVAAILIILSVLGQPGAGPVPPAQAQSIDQYGGACPSRAESAADLLRDADAFRDAKRPADALECYARAGRLAQAAGDRESELKAHLAFAQTAYAQSIYAPAGQEVARAQALAGELKDPLLQARADQLAGAIAQMSGQRDTALRLFRSALAAYTSLGADRDRARALLDIERVTDTPDRAALIDEAIEIARRVGATDLEAVGLHSRADWNFGAGHFDAALTDLNAAIKLFAAEGPGAELANAYVSLGRLLRAHGRAADAIAYYDKAAAIEEQLQDLRGLAQSTNAKAVALGELGRQKESLDAYRRALDYAKKTGSPRIINFQQGNLAAAYASTGDYIGSNRLLREVIAAENDPYILAYRHKAMAENYLSLGTPAEAVPHVDEAVACASRSNNTEFVPSLLYTKARVYRALHRYDEALDAASEAVALVEQIRAKLVPLDFLKRGFGDTWQRIFGLTVALLNERGEADRSLAVSEQARARAFLDLLASRGVTGDKGSTAFGELATGQLSSAAVAGTADVKSIVATATRLQSTVVSFWVNDDETFVWVTAPGGPVRQKRLAVSRRTLETLVTRTMRTRDAAATRAFARLHLLLIAPIGAWLNDARALAIVPHGPLARLSFAALRDPRGTYLIERHAITYAPSISTLLLTATQAEHASPGGEYLLVADPRPMPAATPALQPLPASRREVEGIARVVGPSASLLVGREARESAIRERSRGARVLHLATHGVIRDDEPLDSYLAVSSSGSASESDGRLTVRELYDFKLSADLVVLSACRTASGRVSGDGIAGLSRAFFYAGTPSVIATLWEVADDPSATLMSAFYRHWHAGMTKREALRQAQLELIRALRAGRLSVKLKNGVIPLQEQPFYWAGYVLVGEP